MGEIKLKSIEVSCDGPMDAVRERALELEALGAAVVWMAETEHDAFIQSALALVDTTTIKAATGIVIGLARSPMTIAQEAVDLQDLSHGRFILGLGSQIKPHIVRRFSMPWSKPVAQMRELIQAVRAIWDHWYDGEPLNFLGEHYQLTFNNTAFRRTPRHPQRPPLLLAAVGPKMVEMTANHADGFICHPFMNERYLRDVVTPVLDRGKRSADAGFHRVISPNVVIDDGSEGAARRLVEVRNRMAFYGSTPAYRGVLDVHGLGELHEELNQLSRANEWKRMGEVFDDAAFDLFCVHGERDYVVDELMRRYSDLATILRLSYHARSIVPDLMGRI